MAKAIATGHTQRMEMIGADDRNYEVTSTPFQDIAGETKVIEVVRDITERKQAEEALRESENKYRTLMEEAPIGICQVDIKGKITYVNKTILQGTGYSSEELVGKNAFRLGLIPPETLKLLGRRMKEKLMGKPPSPLEIQFKRKDGKWIWLEIRGKLLSKHGVPVGVQIIGEDITERKRAEEALRTSHAEFQDLYDNAPNAYFSVGVDGLIRRCNLRACELLGYSVDELLGKPVIDLYADTVWGKRAAGQLFERFRAGEPILDEQLQIQRADGSPVWISLTVNAIRDEDGNVVESRSMVVDIETRKRAESVLLEERNKAQQYLDTAGVMFVAIDTEGKVTLINRKGCEVLGYSEEEIVGKNWFEHFIPERIREDLVPVSRQLLAGDLEAAEYRENPLLTKSGEERLIAWHNTILANEDGQIVGHLSSGEDITERRRAEEEVRQLSQYLESIVDNANVWLDVVDNDTNIVLWNKAAEEISGYSRDEVVGHARVWEWLYPDETYRREVLNAAVIHGRESYVDDETTIRCKSGQTKIISWNERQLLDEGGKLVGSTAIGRDVTAQKRVADKLQRALEDTIQAIGLTTETRDPYTAGHQRRVTQLACAVAKKMGLSEEQVESIRVAGLVHDIGKMSVPAEILSKPSRLTEIEFGLIKAHPQVAYDILATIKFPWPVAQIVLQHHERMDGSGYPKGLKGEEIMLEARILAVADVVEAMSSHRPYRPALGIDKALEEIEKRKGTLYDPKVVDACLKLFAEDRFKFAN
jgi:PAS domain S-box-containing protein/putative nucleotidyltransferase with HDIG domain